MLINPEQGKPKRRGLLPLEERMGLDRSTSTFTPARPAPDPMQAVQEQAEGERLKKRFKNRRGMEDGG